MTDKTIERWPISQDPRTQNQVAAILLIQAIEQEMLRPMVGPGLSIPRAGRIVTGTERQR